MKQYLKQQFKIHCLPVNNALQNYIFLIEDTYSRNVVIIDPTEAPLVVVYCQQHRLNPQQIWITHHHHDHVGGIQQILQHYVDLDVYAPHDEVHKIGHVTIALKHEQHFKFHDLTIKVIATTGHTLGHICYFIEGLDALFCGDTLFVMGCGRVFEGTYEQMYYSLQRLAALPIQTQVYCTHEYTQSNAAFALHVEPDNLAIQQRAKEIDQLRAAGQMTIPSTIKEELATNPFLRATSVEHFAQLRQLKDNF